MEEAIKRLRRRLWSWRAVMFPAIALALGALVNLLGYGLPVRTKADAAFAEVVQHLIKVIGSVLPPFHWWLGLSPQPSLVQRVSIGNFLTLAFFGLVLWSAYATYTIQRDLARHRKNKEEAENELEKEAYKKQRRG